MQHKSFFHGLAPSAVLILILAMAVAVHAIPGWVDISANLPAGIDRGRTDLRQVHFINDREGWVCDTGLGAIYHTTDGGGTWSTLAVPGASSGYLPTAIFMQDSLEGWLGCSRSNDSGRLYHTTDGGVTWTALSSVSHRINDISFGPGAKTGVAVGNDGICLSVSATGASRVTFPEVSSYSGDLVSVSTPTARESWVNSGGANTELGYIFHDVDGVWGLDQAGYPDASDLYRSDLFMADTTHGCFVGGPASLDKFAAYGSVYSTANGRDWYRNRGLEPKLRGIIAGASGSTYEYVNGLNGVWFATPDEGWIVGDNGMILHTTNGTATAATCTTKWAASGSYSEADEGLTAWDREAEGLTSAALWQVQFTSLDAGYAVGQGDMVSGSGLHHQAALLKRTALLGPARVEFVVTEGSAVVPGATVTVNGHTAQTDASGRAAVALPTASIPIRHQYSVDSPGLISGAGYVTLAAGVTTKTEAVELEPAPGDFVVLPTEAPGTRTGFKNPQDALVDTAGTMWVLDVASSSVQGYATNGTLAFAWSLGITNPYTQRAVREFKRDATGRWYVLVLPYVDWSRYGAQTPGAIRQYDATGKLLAEWSSTPQTGAFGDLASLALDSAGNLYLGTIKHGILKLDPAGNLLDRFGQAVTLDANGEPVDGYGSTPLSWISSLAVDSTGRIYAGEAAAADGGGSLLYVAVLSPAGRIMVRWGGEQGVATGHFQGFVQGLVCDSQDRVYALDGSANRVQFFSADGTVLGQWGTYGVDDGKLDGPCRMSRDAKGNLYLVEGCEASVKITVNAAKSRIQKFTAAGVWQATWKGTTAVVDGSFDAPWGVGVASTGEVYVSDYDRNRVQKFTADGAFLLGFGAAGGGNGQFNHPTGVAVDASGNVYVGDRYNHCVQVFNSDGSFRAKFGGSGTSGLGNFAYVNSVAIGPDGSVYVGDQRSVQKFSPDGTALARWGSYGSGDGQFYSVNGIGFDAAANLYVTEWDNHRVQVFDAAGNFLRKWGQLGAEDGDFHYGFGLVIDASDYVYVADDTRVQVFTTAGAFVTRFGPYGSAAGKFTHPHGLARGPSGALYLADTFTRAIYRCPAPTPSHRVTFQITDRGQMLSGATVAIHGATATTDAGGVVSFWLPSGTHAYSVVCLDYDNLAGAFVVGTQSVTTNLALTRPDTAGAAFTVTDPAHLPLANVKLLIDAATLRYSDSLGTAFITGLAAGAHTCTATAPGYLTTTASFTAASSGAGQVQIVLAVIQPFRLTLTRRASDAILNWSGGTGPFSVQRAADLGKADWTDVLTNAVPPVTLTREGRSAFFRVSGY